MQSGLYNVIAERLHSSFHVQSWRQPSHLLQCTDMRRSSEIAGITSPCNDMASSLQGPFDREME